MKTKVLGILGVAVVSLFGFAAVASAQTFRSGQTANVATSETINGSAFVAGNTVDVSGTVDGDLYCAGQNVTISGTVNGDVLCAAQTITLSGTVSGDVRLAGQTVAVSGDVKGSATVAGQSLTLEGSGKVGRDALLLGQSANVNGTVARDITIASASAVIDSSVGRNVNAQVETLTLGKNASIAGTVDYTSPNTLTKDAGATVGGKITYTERKPEQSQQQNAGYNVGASVVALLMIVVSALVIALLFPGELLRTTNAAVASVPQALLAVAVGLVASIVAPFAFILLLVTVLGIPFAFVALLAWILILALSGAVAAFYLGRLLWRSQANVLLVMLVGSVVLGILLMIPVLNVLVWLLAVWFGAGAELLQLRKHFVTPHYTAPTPKTKRARA